MFSDLSLCRVKWNNIYIKSWFYFVLFCHTSRNLWRGIVELFTDLFSCESSSRNANVCQSVCLSVRLSVRHAYLFVQFTSIFYNSKSDKLKLSLIINQKTSNMILKITRTLELKAFAVPGTLVLVTLQKT